MKHARATRRRTLFVLSLAVTATLTLPGCDTPPPSDKEVSALLEREMPTFETLLKMLREDPKVGTIGSNFLWVTGKSFESAELEQLGISADRLVAYKRLFDRIGVTRFDRSDDGQSFQFLLWGKGFAGHTQHKGVSWSKQPLTSTENRRYAALRDNWYVFQD